METLHDSAFALHRRCVRRFQLFQRAPVTNELRKPLSNLHISEARLQLVDTFL